ncbi:MAG TPA: hypothetical protein VGO83_03845 [Thermoleophilaceae bacterium]|nr:hypothetical protein [Thermoleophilaceae bacterium]
MSELERQLSQLGRELDWPATPDLAPRVAERLAAERRRPAATDAARRVWPPPLGRPLAAALVALLVLAGGVLAAVPGARDAVLDLFGLRGATVERREQLPPGPERPAGSLELGRPTSLAAAAKRLAFEPLVPRAAGRPDGIFVSHGVPGGRLSLAYRARPGLPEARSTGLGLLVEEFRGDLAPEYLGKVTGQATRVERFRVGGERAVWLEGAPHYFFYRRSANQFAEHELRIAQNVLLLERGPLLVRLEGAFGRERAVELARSLR